MQAMLKMVGGVELFLMKMMLVAAQVVWGEENV
jgi:hypothetical protein